MPSIRYDRGVKAVVSRVSIPDDLVLRLPRIKNGEETLGSKDVEAVLRAVGPQKVIGCGASLDSSGSQTRHARIGLELKAAAYELWDEQTLRGAGFDTFSINEITRSHSRVAERPQGYNNPLERIANYLKIELESK